MCETAPEALTFLEPEWLPSVDSTNEEIKRRLAAGGGAPESGFVLATLEQTKGKGRMGNTWHSSPGASLMFSFLWRGEMDLLRAGTMPMACALAAADFLEGYAVDARIRWPNDVLAEGGKICGILCETSSAGSGAVNLITGIGLNLRNDPVRASLVDKPSTSLEERTGKSYSPDALLPTLLAALGGRITAWRRNGFAGIRDEFTARQWGLGNQARVRTGTSVVNGVIGGVGDAGELLLTDPQGKIFRVTSVSALDCGE